MGREIRRVPENWKHPIRSNDGEPIKSRVDSKDMYATSEIVDFIEEFVAPFITQARESA